MFCTNCGSKSNESDKFCNVCGTPLVKPLKISKINYSSQNFIIDRNTPDNNKSTVMDIKNYRSNYTPKNKKTKKIASTFITLGTFLILISLTLIFINRDTLFSETNGKRTIMVYMIGSDLESEYLSASTDIEEMINSNADFNNINLLLYTGGAKNWHNEEIPEYKNAIFKVTSNGLLKLVEYPRKDMGDSTTLEEFLDYSYKNYKAENYSLILWDHGGGPIYGYGLDEYNKSNSLTLLELANSLRNSPFKLNNKLEFIGFDACLMATAEIAYKLSDYADYMIASQEVEPGNGWDYKFLETIKSDSTTYEIGKDIIDYYSNFYKRKIGGQGTSLSMLNLSKIDNFEQKLNALFKEVDNDLIIDFSDISKSRGNTKTFGKISSSGYDLVDLSDLLDRLPDKYYSEINGLKSAIEDLVVYQKTDLLYTNGISIYFPYENKKQMNNIIYLYKQFNFAEEYTSFIDNFSSRLTGTRLHNWNLDTIIPTEENNKISVSVSEDIVKNYSTASYIIFEKVDEYYMPRFTGTDVELSGNTLSTTFSNKALVATDKEGNKNYITALESQRGTDYIKYIIPGVLQNWEGEYLDNFEMLPIYLHLVVDEENPNGVITGATPIIDEDEENIISPKITLDINNWKVIQLLNTKYKIFDEEGNYTSNWVGSGEITGFEALIEEGFSLEFEDIDISKEYYVLFRIKDSQGNEYSTNVLKLNE